MATTHSDIRRWFADGYAQGATHVVVMVDTYDFEDYPIFIKPGEDPRKKAEEHITQNSAHSTCPPRVLECYDLGLDLEFQLGEERANHWAPRAAAPTDPRTASANKAAVLPPGTYRDPTTGMVRRVTPRAAVKPGATVIDKNGQTMRRLSKLSDQGVPLTAAQDEGEDPETPTP